MALKLDDLINKKKEPNQILDLSKVRVKNKEEFDKYFDKIPEFKIRPEKVRSEDVRVRDTDFSFKHSTRKQGRGKKEFKYADPCPTSMRPVRLEDLEAVDISWRMLTMLRPKNRLEEDIFSRLVELGKLRLGTRNFEAKQLGSVGGGAPGSHSNALLLSMGISLIKSKKGTVETRIKICKECALELCTGAFCKDFPYDSYTRMMLDKDELDKEEGKGGRRPSKPNKGHTNQSKSSKGKNNGGLKLRKKKIKKKTPKKKKEASSEDDK